MPYFVTAIGTDSGKTLVSALLCQALGAHYWKPVQAGLPADTDQVKAWVTHPDFQAWPERYRLQHPMSPHAAARREGVSLQVSDFTLPSHSNLIVEGAGGLLVPINEEHTVADLIAHLNLPIILVANLYLGSINHTLLTLQEIKHRGLRLAGLVFNGPPNEDSQRVIEARAQVPVLFHLLPQDVIDTQRVASLAAELAPTLRKALL